MSEQAQREPLRPLDRLKLLIYALPAAPLAAMGLPLVVFLPPFYTEVVGLELATVGLIFMVARFWDLFTDPLAGIIQDRTRLRFGRRRFWMLVAAPLMSIAGVFLFFPPEGAGALWLLASLFALYVGFTLVSVAHLSWGAELALHAQDRSRVQGWREFAVVAGMLLVLIVPALVNALDLGGFGAEVQIMGLVIIVGVPFTALFAIFLLPEPQQLTRSASLSLRQIFRLFLSNKSLLIILFVELFVGFGTGVLGSLFRFYFVSVVDLGQYADRVLLAYFGTGLLAVPLWMLLSYRIGKRNALLIGLAYAALANLAILLIPTGAFVLALSMMVLVGAVYGASPFLLRALIADVARAEEKRSDAAIAGAYFGLLLMVAKIGLALSVGVTYSIISHAGFDVELRADNSDLAKNVLTFCFVGLPFLAYSLAGLVLLRYPNDEVTENILIE